jgi:hypothetical protein
MAQYDHDRRSISSGGRRQHVRGERGSQAMGAIRESATGSIRILGSPYVVGRAVAPHCALPLNERYVSSVHAEVRWTGGLWELKDLGSRNGTYVDGLRIGAGNVCKIAKGARLGFGKVDAEWELIDDSAPATMAVPLDGGPPVLFEDGAMLALPSKDDPQAAIYRTVDGSWSLERFDEMPLTVKDGQTFEAAGRTWRFCNSERSEGTMALAGAPAEVAAHVRHIDLLFSVSRDEEYVHLRVKWGTEEHDFGARQHLFFLLTLARRWLAEEGEPETSRGWLDQEDVEHDPSMTPSRLNLAIHRIRAQFAKVGVVDFGSIVQRRLRQMRIGTGRITIRTV